VIAVFSPTVMGLALLLPFESQEWPQALLIAFAPSFSSTVFAVKTLGESGDLGSLHGRTAIGILIMQDLFAVVFLTFSTGSFPNGWSLLLLPLLVFARPITVPQARLREPMVFGGPIQKKSTKTKQAIRDISLTS
jgi:Kef-type K+ transport system membrane component KefB